MNHQQIFDKVATHLFTQGRRATQFGPGRPNIDKCVYRNDEGETCAIGCLIPADLYNPVIEGFGVNMTVASQGVDLPYGARVFREILLTRRILTGRYEEDLVTTQLLGELQAVHDDVLSYNGMVTQHQIDAVYDALHEVAYSYSLETQALNEARRTALDFTNGQEELA